MRLKIWENNKSVKVFVLQQDHPIHEQFCKDLLKVFPHQLQAGWDRLVFSGTGEAPKVVESEAEMIEAIQSNPGSIGYIVSKENNYENIQVISIQ